MDTEIIYNEYTNITDAVSNYAYKIKNKFITDIKIIKKINSTDYSNQTQVMIFNEAKKGFSKIGKKIFLNNNENIYVTNEDIKESIAKTIRSTNQKKMLAEHIEIFKILDKIIEKGELIASAIELKNRIKYSSWRYYATPIKINGKKYIVQFDIVLRVDGEKHFRMERIYNLDELIK